MVHRDVTYLSVGQIVGLVEALYTRPVGCPALEHVISGGSHAFKYKLGEVW